MPVAGRNIYLLLFALSGFTGLIYESIWSHYLKLFLGHAAYSQALVLCIFMGGMAIGAWLTAHHLARISNLLVGYAIVEILIGVLGLLFDPVFKSILSFSHWQAIPALAEPGWINLYKWTVAALLILPQSILLGTTFPLMSNGIIRRFPHTPGGSLAMLYFSNSIGASIGVLASGFLFIKWIGLPGTLTTAGIMNIVLGLIVFALAWPHPARAPAEAAGRTRLRGLPLLLLAAAFISSAASFIYEIAWIRMLSLVLGASTHAFELMLSAFILGLALGGLFIHRVIDRLNQPMRFVAWVQVLMGITALLTIPLYNYTYDLMGYFLETLPRDDAGYRLFHLASHSIALVIMLPPTILAGMTLPLFTYILLRHHYGERSIGHIYAANTFGAIIGVAFAIGVGFPWLGLKGLVVLGSGMDMALGFLLLLVAAGTLRARQAWLPIGAALLAFVSIIHNTDIDPRRLASGVFRTGATILPQNAEVLFHRDGRTASISVVEWDEKWRVIMTNGKPDASINIRDASDPAIDESTMIITGALPLAIKPDARRVANIGMGSGLTTHTLLAVDSLELVDTIEIEPVMVEGARAFRPRVDRAYTDPRSHFHYEDAKTFFAARQQQYDLILSEPSNPWVSGVASLFSREFYRDIKFYLAEGGLLVQWLQLYEINQELVMSVLQALASEFDDFTLYVSDNSNLLIVASPDGSVPWPTGAIFDHAELANELELIGIADVSGLEIRYLGNRALYEDYIMSYPVRANSDYFPVLERHAPLARFLKQDAFELSELRSLPVPLLPMLADDRPVYAHHAHTAGRHYAYSTEALRAREIIAMAGSPEPGAMADDVEPDEDLFRLVELRPGCRVLHAKEQWSQSLQAIAERTLPYLPKAELLELWQQLAPQCERPLPATVSEWLLLVEALARRDAAEFTRSAIWLLANSERLTTTQQRHLFSAALLGHVSMEQPQAALKLWQAYAAELYDEETVIPVGLRLLHARASAATGEQTTVAQPIAR